MQCIRHRVEIEVAQVGESLDGVGGEFGDVVIVVDLDRRPGDGRGQFGPGVPGEGGQVHDQPVAGHMDTVLGGGEDVGPAGSQRVGDLGESDHAHTPGAQFVGGQCMEGHVDARAAQL